MKHLLLSLILYLLVINVIGFSLMGIDKSKARKRAWRIPESTLFLFAIFGGSIGSIIGMYVFRHKTKHWYFVVGMPLILILQLIGCYMLLRIPFTITIL
ncbi:MAG: DUF1294 domain-containing protein [Lachnospiraceae bacterium]|nr:DUF1294 domain-containing protein [Lachnospiraceae bacterium]